jgi:hypothetical protein
MHTSHRFDIVSEDVRTGVDQDLQVRLVSLEVADEGLDAQIWASNPGLGNGVGPNRSAAISEVIPVNRRNNNVPQACFGQHLGDAARLVKVSDSRSPRFDITKAAGAGAGVPENHDCGGTAAPALANIGARRFLANGMEPKISKSVSQSHIGITSGCLGSDPLGLAWHSKRAIRTIFQNAIAKAIDGLA